MIAFREVVLPHGAKQHLSWGLGFYRTLCGLEIPVGYERGRAQVKLGECWGVDDDDCQRCAASYRKVGKGV